MSAVRSESPRESLASAVDHFRIVLISCSHLLIATITHDVARPRRFRREGRHGLPQRRELGEFLEGSGRWGERSCVEILTRLNSRPDSGPFQPRFPALILSPDLGPAQLQPQRQNQPSLDPGLRSHSRSRSPKP